MTDITIIRLGTLATIASTLALAVWALRETDAAARARRRAADPSDVAAPQPAQVLRFRCRRGAQNVDIALAPGAVLGRDAACDLALDDRSVSRRHARVGSDGRPWIEDLGSTNGTFVNGRRVEGPVLLKRGDRIGLGTAKIVFLGLAARGAPGAKG